MVKPFVENGVKTSVPSSCTTVFLLTCEIAVILKNELKKEFENDNLMGF